MLSGRPKVHGWKADTYVLQACRCITALGIENQAGGLNNKSCLIFSIVCPCVNPKQCLQGILGVFIYVCIEYIPHKTWKNVILEEKVLEDSQFEKGKFLM